MTFQESLEYLYSRLPMFQRIGAAALKPSLKNTIDLLAHVENPQLKLRTVHIAGTNGKGTSAHTLCSILMEAGYKVGLYTSPHLKSFTERIRVDGREIGEEAVAAFVSSHRETIEQIQPSFFEATFVMAMVHFAQQEVDIAVIETGLGGRLDSTNVIDPMAALITMIGWDHADLLGDSLEKIAEEKAGVIKTRKPVIIGAHQPDLLPVFKTKAGTLKAPLFTCEDIKVRETNRDFEKMRLEIEWNGNLFSCETDITARYYQKNIPGILKTIEVLRDAGLSVGKQAAINGLRHIRKNTGLKGRWQILQREPLMIADISHNLPGLTELFEQVRHVDFRRLHVIFGVVRDKDLTKILDILPAKASYYFTQSSVPRSLPAAELQGVARQRNLPGPAFENVNLAINHALKEAHAKDLIIVCGSTFVVAEIDGL